MNLDFLPEKYRSIISKFDLDKIYEIRLRVGFCPKIYFDNYLKYSNDFVVTDEDIKEVIDNVTEKSLYAYNDYLRKGFLPAKNGIRIGVAGECVYDNDDIVTIKKITSLNIRIPHNIIDCSKDIIKNILVGNEINNTLLISAPFCGKTTILKDLVCKINNVTELELLIVDERGEFSLLNGKNIDLIRYAKKEYAFSYAIRSLSPRIIFTDELSTKEDWDAVKNAIFSGVKVVATCHATNLFELINKQCFINNIFDRYVVINKKNGFGCVENVYDGDLKML